MNIQNFGKFICSLRKENGLTQIDLAERLNVSDKAISRWENGKNYPDIEILEKLAAELGVGVSELIACKRIENNESAEFETAKAYLETANDTNRLRKRFRTFLIFLTAFILVFIMLYTCWFAYWGRRHLVRYDVKTVYLTEIETGRYAYTIDVVAENWIFNPFIHCFELKSHNGGEHTYMQTGGTDGYVVVSGLKKTSFTLEGEYISGGNTEETAKENFLKLAFCPIEEELLSFSLYMQDYPNVEFVFNGQ